MAVKNTILSGTDWDYGTFVIYTDMNDTFNRLYNYARGI